jgi:hypothetical protein
VVNSESAHCPFDPDIGTINFIPACDFCSNGSARTVFLGVGVGIGVEL